MNYAERVRHPSGALDPEPERKPLPWLWWIVVIGTFVVLIWLASRKGLPAVPLSPSPPANPFGWK